MRIYEKAGQNFASMSLATLGAEKSNPAGQSRNAAA
jgi:hypothetical protein